MYIYPGNNQLNNSLVDKAEALTTSAHSACYNKHCQPKQAIGECDEHWFSIGSTGRRRNALLRVLQASSSRMSELRKRFWYVSFYDTHVLGSPSNLVKAGKSFHRPIKGRQVTGALRVSDGQIRTFKSISKTFSWIGGENV